VFPFLLAGAMFVMGAGGGSVVSPNQALTLQNVPVRIGSVAGAMLTVFQQLGSAVGMSVVLAGFFSNIAGMGVRGSAAHSLIASMVFIALAWCMAIYDTYRRSHELAAAAK
jgi:MFS family permease